MNVNVFFFFYKRFLVDLGEGYSCHPTHYTLGYGSPKAYCTPRNWLLQATNDIKVCLKISHPFISYLFLFFIFLCCSQIA